MAGSLNLPTLVQKVLFDARDVKRGASEVERDMNKAGGATSRFEKLIGSAGKSGKLSTLALSAAAVTLVGGLERVVHHAAEYGNSVRNLQAFTGGTAEESSKLAFILGRVGIEANTATRPLALLSRNIENGGANFTKYFTQGELARLKTLSLIQVLPILAQKYRSLNTAQERNAFLLNVFGRGGTQLRRLLALSADDYARLSREAEKFGLVLTQSNIEAFKQFSDAERGLHQALQGLEVQIGAALLPAFDTLTTHVTSVITSFNSLPAPVRQAAAQIVVLAAAFGALSKVASFVGIEGAGAAILGFAGKAVAGARASLGALDALTALEAEGGSLAEIFGTLGVSAVGALVGGLAAAGVAALGVGLGLRSLYGHLVANKVAANQLGDEAGNLVDQLFRVDGGSKAAALGANSANHAFADLEATGKLTDQAMESITEHWGLVLAALRSGADVGAVIKAIADGNIALAASIAGASGQANVASKVQRQLATDLALVAGGVKLQKAALDDLNSAVDDFGIGSKQATDAEERYVEALLRSQGFLLDGTDDEKKLGEARGQAAAAAVEAAQKEADAARERAKQLQADQQSAADAVETAKERVADANQRLADTEQQAAQSIKDADQSIVDAKQGIVDAEAREKDAEEALTDARKQAARSLEDLTFRVEENAISQQRATLRVADARRALADARKSGDPEKIKNAELDLQEAILQQREGLVNAKRDQDELNKRRKEGINGSKEVTDAEKNLADAHKGVSNAIAAESKAEDAAATARRNAIRDVANAERGVRDATKDLTSAINALAAANLALAASLALINNQNAAAVAVVSPDIGTAIGGVLHEGGVVMHKGGEVPRMHVGGLRPDERHVIAQAGEFVIRRTAVESIGLGHLLQANRTGRLPKGADPAMVALLTQIRDALAGGNRAGNSITVVVPHQDERVLARELAYTFGRGR